jgi:diguanylate cyclase (GGDEF)-like protein
MSVFGWVGLEPVDGVISTEQRVWAARLAAALYIGAGAIVLATMWALPEGVRLGPLALVAAVAILIGAVVPLLPWERWDDRAPVVLTFAAYVMLAVAGRAAPGAIVNYQALYTLTFVYIGFTQSRTMTLVALPYAGTSFLLATSNDGSQNLARVLIALPLWALIGISLAETMRRRRSHERTLDALVRAASSLGATHKESDTADFAAGLAEELLCADVSCVLVSDKPGSRLLVNVGQRNFPTELGAFTLDTQADQSGPGLALDAGQLIFVSDTSRSPELTAGLSGDPEARSMAFVPLPGETGRMGVLVVGWHRRRPRLNRADRRTAAVLATETGRVLEGVRDSARLTEQADTDPVTKLANRRRYARALDDMCPGDVVVLLDLDHFKLVNDRLGHAAGDQCLSDLGDCLREVARAEDCVARYGGEEFAMVLAGSGVVGAHSFLIRLRVAWQKRGAPTTFSSGIALHLEHRSPAVTLALADKALYRAKAGGRDRDEVADPHDAEAPPIPTSLG